ncbi:hypothetical protein HJFPF1_07993 [Paramyrothecium foliicola]|nr:hypothetical protein HJFPF1_07993 [Paramyrothecium foliicola]
MQKLTLEEFRANLFNDIVEKVKTELAESCREDSEPETVCGGLRSRAQSTSDASPKSQTSRLYQATVEDADTDFEDTSSCDEGEMTPDSIFAASPTSPTTNSAVQTPASSVRSDSISSATSINSACQQDQALSIERPLTGHLPVSVEQKAKPTVRWSNRPPIVLHNRLSASHTSPTMARPTLPDRTSTDPGLSAVDLKWGELFNSQGQPTKRFEQVVRGVADYLIAEFSPADSLVITPEKLGLFYSRYMLESEVIAFYQIFNCSSKQGFKDIEYLYRDLRCEYHLVQEHPESKPCIPGLTPHGFRDWMTLLMRAYPDREAKRLCSIVEDLPIEADGFALNGGRERLPKQISRHLFPANRHDHIYNYVSRIFVDWKKMTGYKEPVPPASPTFPIRPIDFLQVASGRADTAGRYGSNRNYHTESPRTQMARSSSYTQGYTYAEPTAEHQAYATVEKRGRQKMALSPPPIGIHHQQRKRSPREVFRHRDPPGLAGNPESHYRPDYGRPESNRAKGSVPPASSNKHVTPSAGDCRRREDEYRFLQGRDPRASLESGLLGPKRG